MHRVSARGAFSPRCRAGTDFSGYFGFFKAGGFRSVLLVLVLLRIAGGNDWTGCSKVAKWTARRRNLGLGLRSSASSARASVR